MIATTQHVSYWTYSTLYQGSKLRGRQNYCTPRKSYITLEQFHYESQDALLWIPVEIHT